MLIFQCPAEFPERVNAERLETFRSRTELAHANSANTAQSPWFAKFQAVRI